MSHDNVLVMNEFVSFIMDNIWEFIIHNFVWILNSYWAGKQTNLATLFFI